MSASINDNIMVFRTQKLVDRQELKDVSHAGYLVNKGLLGDYSFAAHHMYSIPAPKMVRYGDRRI